MIAKFATDPAQVIAGAESVPSTSFQNKESVHPVPLFLWSILFHSAVAVVCSALFLVPHTAINKFPFTLDAGKAGVALVAPAEEIRVPAFT